MIVWLGASTDLPLLILLLGGGRGVGAPVVASGGRRFHGPGGSLGRWGGWVLVRVVAGRGSQ